MSALVLNKNRNITFDIARLLACFFVVLSHVVGWWKFREGIVYIPKSVFIIDSFSRWCLLFFFMACGAFNNNTDLKKNTIKMIKIAVVFFSVSILYALTNMLFKYFTTNEIVFDLFSNGFETKYHIWFLKSYIMILTIAPILNYCLDKFEGLYKYILIIWGISVIIPTTLNCLSNSVLDLKPIISLFKVFPTFLSDNYVGYFVLGKYLYKKSKTHKINIKLNVLLFVLSGICITILSIVYTKVNHYLTQNWFMSPNNVFKLIQSICIFNIFASIEVQNKILKKIAILSKYTFFIYLIHPLIMDIFNITGLETFAVERGTSIPVLIKCGISTVVVFIISLLLGIIYHFIIDKIKNIRTIKTTIVNDNQ